MTSAPLIPEFAGIIGENKMQKVEMLEKYAIAYLALIR
jgi:hypothetical protein